MRTVEKRFRFTVQRLTSLPIPDKPAVYYDSAVPQLGIRVQPSGRKSFWLLKQVRGKPERITLGVFPEMAIEQARRFAHGKLNELAEWKAKGCPGLSPLARPEQGFCLADAFETYVKYLHAPRQKRPIKDSAKAEARARWLFESHLFSLRALPLEQVTDTRVETLHHTIGNENGKIAANRAIEFLRAVFRHALRKKLTTAPDPTANVDKYPERKRKRFLQPEELVRFHQAVEAEPNADLRDFVLLLLATGVRKSNLYAARFEEVSEPLKVWNIPTSKNGEPLTIQLTPKALSIFRARRERIGDDEPWVFPSDTSESGHVTDFKNQWDRLRTAANLPDIHLHDLRRTNASYQAISGASLKVIGDSLGHKSTDSTQVYAHLHGDAVRNSLLAGEEMQREMMAAAKRQLRTAERRRLLPAKNSLTVGVNRG